MPLSDITHTFVVSCDWERQLSPTTRSNDLVKSFLSIFASRTSTLQTPSCHVPSSHRLFQSEAGSSSLFLLSLPKKLFLVRLEVFVVVPCVDSGASSLCLAWSSLCRFDNDEMVVAATASFHRPPRLRPLWRLALVSVMSLVVLSAALSLLVCGKNRHRVNGDGPSTSNKRQQSPGTGATPIPSVPVVAQTGGAWGQDETANPADGDPLEISPSTRVEWGDPCGVVQLWYDAKFEKGYLSSISVNYLVTGLVAAIKRDRPLSFGIPFTAARRGRKWLHQGTKCTRERALGDVDQVMKHSDVIRKRWKQLILATIKSSLEYRVSSVLSPSQRARCFARFVKGVYGGWSQQCQKRKTLWVFFLKKMPMCRGDRWRICSDYQHVVNADAGSQLQSPSV